MSRDKQIEEMACQKCLHYEGCLKRFREAKKNGQYEFTDETEYFAHSDECDFFITGYRKAEDVAREIFEEIEKMLKGNEAVCENKRLADIGNWIFHEYLPKELAELKKKYTESEDTE